MQVVIEIPESQYKTLHAKTQEDAVDVIDDKLLIDAIKDGTLLPEGHGRLGDLSKIYVELNEAQIEGTEEYKGLGEAKQIVCNAPTLIEAREDKEWTK